MIEIGSRERALPAPPHVVWGSLTTPHRPAARPWLSLLEDEVEPRVLEAEPSQLVVWSSLWPARPEDVVRLELAPRDDGGTSLRWTLLSPAAPPGDSLSAHLRHRLDVLINADLRLSYGQ